MSYITYLQYDSRWGKKNYNGSSTMATAGCGPTSVAMLAYAVDGKTTPWDVALYMKQHGYAVYGHGTAWDGIPAAMKHFGLEDVKNVADMSDVFSYLAKGYCAVFLFKAGSRGGVTWTTSGHYVAVTDYKKEGGKHYLYTRDSGGRGHTGFYVYETKIKGLVPQVWVGKVPPKIKKRGKDQYQGTLPTKTVKKGDKGQDVKNVQLFLRWANSGGYMGAWLKELKGGGEFKGRTYRNVCFFQEVHHLKVDGIFGPKCIKLAEELTMTPQLLAVNWAVAISKDNSFAYGTGSRAHHNGCYFCGTTITGPKHAEKGSKWEKTYCCNPFIHAAWAHGAKIKKMLTDCKHDHAADMVPKSWKKYSFRTVGKVKNLSFSKLRFGDVVIINHSSHHVWMYTGADGIVEASGGTFAANSIAHKTGAKKRFNSYKRDSTAYVMRYKG